MSVENGFFPFSVVLSNRMACLMLFFFLSTPASGTLNKINHEVGCQTVNSTVFLGAVLLIKRDNGLANNARPLDVSNYPVGKSVTKIKKGGVRQKKASKERSKVRKLTKNKLPSHQRFCGKGYIAGKHPFFRYPVCQSKTTTGTIVPKRIKRSQESGLTGKTEFYFYVYRRFENGTFVDDDFTDKNNTEVLNEIRHRPVYLCKAKLNINKIGFTKKNIEKIEIIAYGKKQGRGFSWHQWSDTENSAELLQEYKEKMRGRNPVVMVEGCCVNFEQEVQLMGFTARHNEEIAKKDNARPLFLVGIVWPTTGYYRKDGSYDDDRKAFRQDNIIADNAAEPMRVILNTIVDDARSNNDTVPKVSVVAHSRGGANIMAMLRGGDLPDHTLSSLNLVSSDLSEKYFQSGGQPLFTNSKGVLERWVCSQSNTTQEDDCASKQLRKVAKAISIFYSPDDAAFSEPQKIPAFVARWYGVSDLINKTSDAIGGRHFSKPGAQPDFISDRSLGAMEAGLSFEAQKGRAWDKDFSGGHGNMYWNEGFNNHLVRKLREQSPDDLKNFCYRITSNRTVDLENASVFYITQRLPIMEGDRVYGFYEGSLSRSAYNDSTGRNVSSLGWGIGIADTAEEYFPVTGIEEPCAVHFKDYQKNNTKEDLIERLKIQIKSASGAGLLLYIGDDESVTRSMQLSVIYKRLGDNVTTLLYAPPGSGVRDKGGFLSTKSLASASKKQTAAVLEIAFRAVQAVGSSAKLYLVCKGTGGYFLKAGLESLFESYRASSFLKGGPIKSVILPASLLTESELEGGSRKSLYGLIKKLLPAEGKILIPYGNYYEDWDNSNQIANQVFQCDNPATHYGYDLCYSSGLDVLPGRCRYSDYPVSAYLERQNCIQLSSVKPFALTVPKRLEDYDGDLRELYDPECRNEIKLCLSPSGDSISYTEVPTGQNALNMTVFPTSHVPSDEHPIANRTAGVGEKEIEEYTVTEKVAVEGSTPASPLNDQNATTVQDRVTVVMNRADKEKLSTVYTVPWGAGIDGLEEGVTNGQPPSATDKSTVAKGAPVLPVAVAAGGFVMLVAIATGCYYCRTKATSSFCVCCQSVFCEDCRKRFSECCQPGVPADQYEVKFQVGLGDPAVGRRLAEKDTLYETDEISEKEKMLVNSKAAETSM